METPNRARTEKQVEELAIQAGSELEEADALGIVRWAAETFGRRLCVTSSMTDALVAHLTSQVFPGVDVLFLDTGYHFPETIGTRDAVSTVIPVNVINLTPRLTVAEQDIEYGPRLYERDPNLCCRLRKVEPLAEALKDYDAWITGLRRDESPSRANTPVVGWDATRRKVKISPIASWSQEDVDSYAAQHSVIVNPLLMEGYSSIGCAPCTRPVSREEHVRAGRWPGFAKTECGLHE